LNFYRQRDRNLSEVNYSWSHSQQMNVSGFELTHPGLELSSTSIN
jgi:hypothetical protein